MAVQQVRVQVNGTWHILTYNGSTGKYEKTITAPATTSFNQPGGYYQCVVEATDDHGNVTTDSNNVAARLVVKEVTAPVITITSPAAGARLTSSNPPIIFTLRDEAGGSGVKLTTLALKIDGGSSIGSGSPGMVCKAVTIGYDCTYTPQTPLTDGSHTITINVQDNDGNAATQKSVSFTVDTVAPTLNVTAPVNNLKTNNASCNVVGQTNDATSSPVTVTVKLNGVDQGTVSVDGSGNFTKNITLVAGNNTIVVRSTDQAGKYTEITRYVSLNQIAPVISNISITPNPADVGESILISCTVTDE